MSLSRLFRSAFKKTLSTVPKQPVEIEPPVFTRKDVPDEPVSRRDFDNEHLFRPEPSPEQFAAMMKALENGVPILHDKPSIQIIEPEFEVLRKKR